MYGIYANIGGILMVNVTIYSSTMDPSWGLIPIDLLFVGGLPMFSHFWMFQSRIIPDPRELLHLLQKDASNLPLAFGTTSPGIERGLRS